MILAKLKDKKDAFTGMTVLPKAEDDEDEATPAKEGAEGLDKAQESLL